MDEYNANIKSYFYIKIISILLYYDLGERLHYYWTMSLRQRFTKIVYNI